MVKKCIKRLANALGISRNPLLKLRLKSAGDVEKDAGVFWDSSESQQVVRELAHWRGEGRWSDEDWLEVGDFNIALILKYLKGYAAPEYRQDLSSKVALEWGPGGGANVRILCENFAKVYGVDISASSLKECETQIKNLGFTNFYPVHIVPERPESVFDEIERDSVDFVLSTAVFQLFPSKDYSLRVLNVMAGLLGKNSFGLIQVRYFDGSKKLEQKTDRYFENVVTMTSFTYEEFSKQLEESGFTLLFSERDVDRRKACYEYHFFGKDPSGRAILEG